MLATSSTFDWRVIAIVAAVFVVVIVLGYRLMNRDPTVRKTRWGFFVERERYDDEVDPWPEPPPIERTLPQWPDRDDTIEKPPPQEK